MAVFLVTGGAGFIGAHLTKALLEQGHDVRILDNIRRDAMPGLAFPGTRLQVISGDLHDLPLVRQAAQGVETVFHLAMPSKWGDPPTRVLTQHAATTGTMHVLIAAREGGVRRVVYASCGSVYGLAPAQPVNEDSALSPASELAVAKETGEKDCYAFSYLYGLETVRLRLFGVYGPRQPDDGRYGRFVLQALTLVLAGQVPELPVAEPPADGHDGLDLLFVDDAVHAMVLAARAPRVSGKAYNVGFGQAVTPLKILDLLKRMLTTTVQPRPLNLGPRTEFDNLPDITKAETELGFCPAIGLEAGLRRTIDFYLHKPAPPAELVQLAEPQEPKKQPSDKEIPSP